MTAPVDILAIGAHPDDVELTCAATLVKMSDLGHRTAVVDMTRGETGSRGTREIRDAESKRATEILGLSERLNLDLPDAGLFVNDGTLKKTVEAIRLLRPDVIIAPHWEGYHPDHVACSRIVKKAVFLAGLAKYDSAGDPHKIKRLLFTMFRVEFRPSFVVDVSGQFDRRLAAIRCYASQLFDPSQKNGPPTDIAQPDFLDGIITRAKYYGSLIGAVYGEPFHSVEMLEIDDPVKAFRDARGIAGRGLI